MAESGEAQIEATPGAGDRKPWDQMPGEPDKWYGRFLVYLNMGPARSFMAAGKEIAKNTKAGNPYNGFWTGITRQWRWRERARAWDIYQRDVLAISERNMRLALRSRRVELIEDYLDSVCGVLDNAKMWDADEEQAREWLPQMRVFLRDLLTAERLEFERLDYERDEPTDGLVITADDLRAAQRQLETSATKTAPMYVSPSPPKPERYLFVCVGEDRALMLDLAALRAVRSATNLRFVRLLNATRVRFATTLRRERSFGRPVELLHLAVHASPAGVEFADGIADADWLSEQLLGVQVMLLAGCEGDSIGDWLGVVPHVVTLSEEISHEDAAILTQHFWHNIGLQKEPGEALNEALALCPPVVSEYVVRHW
ncbi:MAG: hypothetical protein U0X20_12240 [Caldilineaceae bacterium]